MGRSGIAGLGNLSADLLAQIDDVCDRFEDALKKGGNPSADKYLVGLAEDARQIARDELSILRSAYGGPQRNQPSVESPLDQSGRNEPAKDPARNENLARPISLTCGNGHKLLIKREWAGRKGHCPRCKELVEVPQLPAGTETIDWAQSAEDETLDRARVLERDGSAPHFQRIPLGALGRFTLLEVLGEGAFGTVYRAHDPELDRIVALKIPRAGTLLTEGDFERFLREARAAGQLRHPHIVPIYTAGKIGATPYIASAFVKGMSLRDLNRRDRHFTPRRSALFVAKLASALHYAHSQGIIHRDIKPENIMVDEQDEPHVMDFGLARRYEGEALRTQDGMQMGTPAYMSPEQAMGKSHLADARSDLWSLGVMLYECLAGKRPFRGQPPELLNAICNDEPIRLRKIAPSVPKDLETVCLKCLAKEPTRRYASAGVLAEELNRWLRDEPVLARPLTIAERAARWIRKNPALSTLAGTVTLLVIAIAIGSTIATGYLLTSRSELQHALDNATKAEGRTTIEARRAAEQSQRSQEETVRAEKALQELKDEIAARSKAEEAAQVESVARKAAEADAEASAKARADAETNAIAAAALRDDALQKHPELLYVDNIARARGAIGRASFQEARTYLDQCPTAQRSWEWGLCAYLCRTEQAAPPKLLQVEVDRRRGPPSLTFSPDGSFIRCNDTFLDSRSSAQLFTFAWPHDSEPAKYTRSFMLSRDWRKVLIGTPTGLAHIQDIEKGEASIVEFEAGGRLEINANGTRVLARELLPGRNTAESRSCRLFDIKGDSIPIMSNIQSNVPRNVPPSWGTFSPCGRWLYVRCGHFHILCSTATGDEISVLNYATSVEFQPTGDTCLVSRGNNSQKSTQIIGVDLYDIQKKQSLKRWSMTRAKRKQARYSPQGRWLIVDEDSEDKPARLIVDTTNGETVAKLQLSASPVFSSDEAIAAFIDPKKQIVVRDLAAREDAAVFPAGTAKGLHSISADQRYLIAKGPQPGFLILAINGGEVLRSQDAEPVLSSADGQRFLCSRPIVQDAKLSVTSLSVVDARSGKSLMEFDEPVINVAFNSDGSKCATVNQRGEVRLWVSDPVTADREGGD